MRKRAILGAALIAAGLAAAPAAAVVTTFATYSAVGGTNVRLTNNGTNANRTEDARIYTTATPTSTTPGTALVNFSYLSTALAPFVTNVAALYTLNGVIAKDTPATTGPGGVITQGGFSGTFSFVTTSGIMVSGGGLVPTFYAAGSNLLSGTFINGAIVGRNTSGSSFASGLVSAGTLSFTSDFLNFDNSIEFDRAQSFTAVNPTFAIGANGALRAFRGVAGGQFSADPIPKVLAQVPEPATWGMMILGFGLVGATARRRRQKGVLA